MQCLYCGNELGLLKELTDGEFCSRAHRQRYKKLANIAVHRLLGTEGVKADPMEALRSLPQPVQPIAPFPTRPGFQSSTPPPVPSSAQALPIRARLAAILTPAPALNQVASGLSLAATPAMASEARVAPARLSVQPVEIRSTLDRSSVCSVSRPFPVHALPRLELPVELGTVARAAALTLAPQPAATPAAAALPELGQYVTHVRQLKYAKPSEMVPVLQPFVKIPNAILPIDTSMILVLRDYAENVKRMLELIDQIDVAIPSEFVSEVIPIKYALASEIASALNSLSTSGGGATVGGTIVIMPAAGKNQQAAAKLLAWMEAPQQVADIMYQMSNLPSSIKASKDARFATIKNFQVFIDIMANPKSSGLLSSPINQELNDEIAKAEESIWAESADPAKLLNDIQTQFEQQLKDAWSKVK